MSGLIGLSSGNLSCQLSRSVLDRIHAFVQVLQFLPLLVILSAQSLIFMVDAQMTCLLGKAIESIDQATHNRKHPDCGHLQPAFVDANATYMGSGTGSTGDNKGVKTVVSGHQFCSCRSAMRACKSGAARRPRKSQTPTTATDRTKFGRP